MLDFGENARRANAIFDFRHMGALALYRKLFLRKASPQAGENGNGGHARPLETGGPMRPQAASRGTVAARFRAEIEKAEAEGVAREDMTLRLTLRDANQLRRDPSLPVADISYAGGVMRFLGVKVEPGGVAESELAR
jgi:hypothetical protein